MILVTNMHANMYPNLHANPNPNDGGVANAVAELSTRNAWNVLSSRMSSTIERAFTE